jgi:hypothetical protein
MMLFIALSKRVNASGPSCISARGFITSSYRELGLIFRPMIANLTADGACFVPACSCQVVFFPIRKPNAFWIWIAATADGAFVCDVPMQSCSLFVGRDVNECDFLRLDYPVPEVIPEWSERAVIPALVLFLLPPRAILYVERHTLLPIDLTHVVWTQAYTGSGVAHAKPHRTRR